jgi:hypothetical protein
MANTRDVAESAAARDQVLLVAINRLGERLWSAAATATSERASLIASLPKIENVLAIGLLKVVGDGGERFFPIAAPTVRDKAAKMANH